MAVLDTVSDYLSSARTLLQDLVIPYRYSDADLVADLNMAISEIVTMRPDLYMRELRNSTVPTAYSSGSPSTPVSVDLRYRVAVLDYIVGHAQLRDDEETSDKRAAALLALFQAKLRGVTS